MSVIPTGDSFDVEFGEVVTITGKDGKDGQTPYIGENGNWWIGETDTGVKADYEDSIEKLSTTLEQTTEAINTHVYHNEKRLENIEAMLDPAIFLTDATTAYQKTVPAKALPYAAIEKIGGALTPDLLPVKVTKIVSSSPNFIDEKGIGRITVNAKGDKRYGWIIPVKENGTYTLSVYGEYDLNKMAIAYKIVSNGSYSKVTNLTTAGKTRTFTANTGDKILVHLQDGYTALQPNQTLQLNKGEYMPYQPYEVFDTFQIPAEVQALPDYGVGLSTVCNEVDFEERKYTHRVVSAVLPTSGWEMINGIIQIRWSETGLPQYSQDNRSLLSGYNYKSDSLSKDLDWWFLSSSGLRLKDGRFATIEEFITHIEANPLTIVYPIAEPVEIDISSYDNLIRVGGDGTLTFVNESSIAVPSTVTYQQEVSV